jgi:hypothetical protein
MSHACNYKIEQDISICLGPIVGKNGRKENSGASEGTDAVTCCGAMTGCRHFVKFFTPLYPSSKAGYLPHFMEGQMNLKDS